MGKLKGTGMLAIWCDIPPSIEKEFNKWYNEEHIYERSSVPGILNAARYEAVVNGPKHLAVYELESVKVLQSPEYLELKAHPSDWSRKMSLNIIATRYVRNVYQQIFPESADVITATSGLAPALQIGRMGIPSDVEDEWNEWYNNIYLPNYETVPGVIRARRYKTVDGAPNYMTFYEMESTETSQTDEWFKRQTAHPSNTRMLGAMQHEPDSPGIWAKTFEPS